MRRIITLLLSVICAATLFVACNLFAKSIDDDDISLSLSKSEASLCIGQMDAIDLTVSRKQNEQKITWTYDETIIFAKTDNYGAVITGLTGGTTKLTASCNGREVSCFVTISNDSLQVNITNPYIYASDDYLDIQPNERLRISAALFGGTSADINGFTWSCDKPSVVSLTSEGNYCWLTGVNDGFAKVTVRHAKAAYGYSVLVNCSSDGTTVSYITTPDNIVTINLSEGPSTFFSVDLVNPTVTEYESGFTYTVVDSLGNELASAPVSISGAGGSSCYLTGLSVGECYVRCTHPNALYSLDVLVRVIEDVETAYIEPTSTLVTLIGSESSYVSLELINYRGEINENSFSWAFSENAENYISYEVYNGSSDTTGNKIKLTGLKTGSVNLTVSYPGVPSRNIIVLIRDMADEAANATTYITTDQNYIRLALGDDSYQINAILKNCAQGDINNLHWKITSCAKDGSSSDVVRWTGGNGTSFSASSNARSVSTLKYNESAFAVIEPVCEGTAYIDISHSKAIYPTRISIDVSAEKASVPQKAYLSLSGSPVIRVKNGNTANLSVLFSGSGSQSSIVWSSSGSATVSGNETNAVVTAPAAGSGGSSSTITVSHPNANYPVTFTVLCYDTTSDLDTFDVKMLYTTRSHEALTIGDFIELSLDCVGFETFPSVTWNCTEGNNSVISVENSGDHGFKVTALNPGTAIVTASYSGCADVTFTITVRNIDIINEAADCYLSTTNNVVYFNAINETQDITIEPHNIATPAYNAINWVCSNDAFDIASNGNKATITAREANASAVLTVTHPLSLNTLTINLKVGKQFEYINPDVCYITTDKETIELYAGQNEVSITAKLNHTEQSDEMEITKGFSFTTSDAAIADITYVNNTNICYVRPISAGTATVTVHHSDASYDREVLIVVNKALNGDLIPYITTDNNVVTVIQGEYVPATVILKNCDLQINSCWSWESKDTRVADISANNGSTALISGNKPGTTEIVVKHQECLYPMKLIVICLDSSVITTRPYIKSSDSIITLQKGTSATLTTQMMGGTDADNLYFNWACGNSSLCLINPVSESCYIKALETGMAYITIKNSRYPDAYSKTVLVIIEENQQEGCYISPSQNIIKIKPDEKGLITVSATLVNGDATDGERFVWWADDYNLIGINALADQCSIQPTGRSGTTKLHVKHEKAAKTCDILIMVSSYDTFAFSKKSASVVAGTLNFIPLQVPTTENAYTIKYTSSDTDVCIIDGSSSIAFVCGQNVGTANLTASMRSSDGTEIASTEMLVSVSMPTPSVPVISLGQAIITMEAGTSQTFSATITGESINADAERYHLKWQIENPGSQPGVSILEVGADSSAYGSNVHITANYPGDYVLTCSHSESGATASMCIHVEEKGKISMELNTYYEEVYREDGSFTITAILNNASEDDNKNISWSAIKIGGSSIVSVSKTKGKNCTVVPVGIGQTSVIAKLPDGTTARCIVVVKAEAEVHLETGSIHVIPGYTEIVPYTTTPANATITTISTFTDASINQSVQYFSVENDAAKKQLRITGIKDYPSGAAGTVALIMMGAPASNLPKLNVYCQYSIELSLLDENKNHLAKIHNNDPDTKNTKKFKIMYYPNDLDITITSGNGALVTVGAKSSERIMDDGISKSLMTVELVPHSEGDTDITVTAKLPSFPDGEYSKKENFFYSAYYDEYDIVANFDATPAGAFSRYDNGTIYLSDGEEVIFYVKIANENAAGKINAIAYNQDQNTAKEFTQAEGDTVTQTDRAALKEKVFGNNNKNVLDTLNLTPITGLIAISGPETNLGSSQAYYRLRHCWDYYKELPAGVEGVYDKDCLNKDYEYYLVSKELVKDSTYYAIGHDASTLTMRCKWEKDTYHYTKKYWLRKEHHYCGIVRAKVSGSTVWEYKNDGNNGFVDMKWDECPNFTYYDCIPYVITKNELQSNAFFSLPYTTVSYSQDTWDIVDEDCDENVSLPKMCGKYITPTISRDKTDVFDNNPNAPSSASLVITYTNGRGGKSDDVKTIPIKFERRKCKAYTNKEWYKKNVTYNGMTYEHYVLDDKVIENLVAPEAFFGISPQQIIEDVSQVYANSSMLDIHYSYKPCTTNLTVKIGPGTGATKLKLLNGRRGDIVRASDSTTYYDVLPDSTVNGIATGTLRFSYTGALGKLAFPITITGPSGSKSVSVDCYFENPIPKITFTSRSGFYSRYDRLSNMLIIGDGESVGFNLQIEDGESAMRIRKLKWKKFTDNFSLDNTKDGYGKAQHERVNMAVIRQYGSNYSLSSEYVCNNWLMSSMSVSITASHDLDYGWYKNIVNGTPTYVKKFYDGYVPSSDGELNAMQIENMSQTADVPLMLTISMASGVISSGITSGITSYTYPSYYQGSVFIAESKNYNVTPVGVLCIEFTDEDGNLSYADILVAVEIRNVPSQRDNTTQGILLESIE